jgi:hypothetical protein
MACRAPRCDRTASEARAGAGGAASPTAAHAPSRQLTVTGRRPTGVLCLDIEPDLAPVDSSAPFNNSVVGQHKTVVEPTPSRTVVCSGVAGSRQRAVSSATDRSFRDRGAPTGGPRLGPEQRRPARVALRTPTARRLPPARRGSPQWIRGAGDVGSPGARGQFPTSQSTSPKGATRKCFAV